MLVPSAPALSSNIDFQIEIVPADGIRLPFFLEAETSVRRCFWAALDQSNRLTALNLPLSWRNTQWIRFLPDQFLLRAQIRERSEQNRTRSRHGRPEATDE
jgi:hypothetical protein